MPYRQTLLAPPDAAPVHVVAPPPRTALAHFGIASKTWPDTVAYREAIQNPSASLSDVSLSRCVPVLDRRGLPVAYSGRFAIVFQLRDEQTGETWALRCFTSPDGGGERAARYESIARYLADGDGDSPFTPFRFLARGIRVGQTWYPAVAMRWADGAPLGRWVEERRNDPAALRRLADALDNLLATLEARHVAHGDWQHDNILVAENAGGRVRLTLVDYDGVYTPELDGLPAPEAGHPNYQHPRRNAAYFGVGLDRFAHHALTAALYALALDPGLWERAGHDGESVLFRRADYEAPDASRVFALVREVAARTGDAVLKERIAALDDAVRGAPGDLLVPLSAEVRAQAQADGSRFWWVGEEAERAFPAASLRVPVARSPLAGAVVAKGVEETGLFRYLEKLYLPSTMASEGDNRTLSRAGLVVGFVMGVFFWLSAALELPNGAFNATLYSLLYLLSASLLYLQWPRKKLYDDLLTEYGKAKMRVDNATERLARHDNRLSLNARYALSIGEQAFVHQRLLEAQIGEYGAPPWIPGGEITARRLRAAGVHSLADLHDALFIPSLSEMERSDILQTRRFREVEARSEYFYLNNQRRSDAAQRTTIEAEREGLRAELSQLETERAAFPNASVWAYARRLVGLPV